MKHCVLNAQQGKHLAAVNLMGSEERSPEKVAKGGEPGDTRNCFLAGASNHRISCSCFTSWHNKEQRKKEEGTRNTDRATTWTMSSTSCAWTTKGIGKSAHCINWFSDFFMANWQRFRGWNKKTGTGITRT